MGARSCLSSPNAADVGDRLAAIFVTAAFGLGTGGLVWVGLAIRSCLAFLA